MFNFFYIYSCIWSIVLFLYLLGWSGLNAALDPMLLLFFLTSVVLSLALGKWFSARFDYDQRACPPRMPWAAVAVIVVCGIFGIVQLGFVPLVELNSGSFDYENMLSADSNIFRTIGIVGCVFGIGYQFARLQVVKSLQEVVKLLLFLGVLFLFAARSPIVIAGTTCLILFLARHRGRLNIKQGIAVALIVIVGLWLFGVFGNIRQGYDWNDSSYIYLLGYFNGYWPSWIPREFCWAYSYLTSPLANLNYSLQFSNTIDPVNFIYDFLPLALSKRLPLYETAHAMLQVSYFNVSSVWSNYYIHLSFPGFFLGYLAQMALLGLWHCVARGTQNVNLMLAYCSECVIMSFFVNSFAYPTMAYPAVLLFVISLVQAVHDRRGQHSMTSSAMTSQPTREAAK